MSFPKRCGCGKVYTAAEWARLPGRKVWHVDEESTLELRDCGCRSTLAVEITLSEVVTGRRNIGFIRLEREAA